MKADLVDQVIVEIADERIVSGVAEDVAEIGWSKPAPLTLRSLMT